MGLLRKTVEIRRRELISKLIELDQYKKDGKHLYELTLTELEYEYLRTQSNGHPHSSHGSLRWKN